MKHAKLYTNGDQVDDRSAQRKARAYHEAARMADGADNSNKSLDGSLYRLREEQFNAMACKLQKVLDGKSRRVEITL